jgi:hypothetical protein
MGVSWSLLYYLFPGNRLLLQCLCQVTSLGKPCCLYFCHLREVCTLMPTILPCHVWLLSGSSLNLRSPWAKPGTHSFSSPLCPGTQHTSWAVVWWWEKSPSDIQPVKSPWYFWYFSLLPKALSTSRQHGVWNLTQWEICRRQYGLGDRKLRLNTCLHFRLS